MTLQLAEVIKHRMHVVCQENVPRYTKAQTGQSDILDSFQTWGQRHCIVVVYHPGLCDNQYLKQQLENMWNQQLWSKRAAQLICRSFVQTFKGFRTVDNIPSQITRQIHIKLRAYQFSCLLKWMMNRIGQHKTTPPENGETLNLIYAYGHLRQEVVRVCPCMCVFSVCLNQWSSPDTRWPHKSLFVDHLSGGRGLMAFS